MTSKEICIWLTGIKGIGCKKIGYLLNELDSIFDVLDCSEEKLSGINGISNTDVKNIINARDLEYIKRNVYNKLESLEKKGIWYVDYFSNEYPKKLKNIYDSPLGLYVRGTLPDEDEPVVAIVGARNCSEYGRGIASEFARGLADLGVGVISGLARGVDLAAHKACILAGGRSYGVLGCGIDNCYPPESIDEFMGSIEQGGVISEYGMGVLPIAGNFPMRNRIISGLCDVVLVVEAKKKSGSLITADIALEQGKGILAVPGRVTDVMSEGCNNLINNGASMALSVDDVVKELGNSGFCLCQLKEKDEINKNITLATSDKIVYDMVCLVPKSISDIMKECNMGYQKVAQTLIKLELADMVVQTSKGYYARVAK